MPTKKPKASASASASAINDSAAIIEKNQKLLKKKNKKIRNLYIVIGVITVVFLGVLAYGTAQYRQVASENKRLSNPEESAKVETARLKAAIAKLVDVPSDEEPTIATVTDVSKLKDQAFFAKAENGDKVFMYAKAKKAILYRPSTGKVVEFAPINSDTNTPDKADGVKSTDTQSSTSPSQTSTTPSSTPTTQPETSTTP